jgi:hypothetical protein
LLGRDCLIEEDWCTIASGVTESGIAGIAMFLRATLDRATILLYQEFMEVRARQIQGGGIFAKVEFVRYCVEYLYSPIMMRLELYLAV